MGQKVNPNGFRLSSTRDWRGKWFAKKELYSLYTEEDSKVRKYIRRNFKDSAISEVLIDRAGDKVRIKILTPRPSYLYGRKGQEYGRLKMGVNKVLGKEVIVDVQEVSKPETDPASIAYFLAKQLERRNSPKKIMKRAVLAAKRWGVKGIRIQCSGRLGGAEIARKEDIREGSIPLHSIGVNVRYALAEASTVYGKIGVKCWVYSSEQS